MMSQKKELEKEDLKKVNGGLFPYIGEKVVDGVAGPIEETTNETNQDGSTFYGPAQ